MLCLLFLLKICPEMPILRRAIESPTFCRAVRVTAPGTEAVTVATLNPRALRSRSSYDYAL